MKTIKDLNTIKVGILNVSAINDYLTKYAYVFYEERGELTQEILNSRFELRGKHLCIAKSESGKIAILDNELVGDYMENSKIELSVYARSQKGFSIFPVLIDTLTSAQLQEFLTGEDTVQNFMGGRFNYNSRIESNQREFINFING